MEFPVVLFLKSKLDFNCFLQLKMKLHESGCPTARGHSVHMGQKNANRLIVS